MLRSATTAVFIAVAIQIFTVGILAPRLPREVCRPGIQSERAFTLALAKVLHVVNADGSVRIEVDETLDHIQVNARIRAYTDSAGAQATAESYLGALFEITETGAMARIVTEPGVRPDLVDLRVNYRILVPAGMDIALDVANGNVWIGPGCNNISVEGNNADVEVAAPAGAVSVKTINGRIRARECASETILETINGSITASLKAGALQASTTTGAIMATLLEDGVETCDLTSLNGSITLVMSEQCGADVNASTARGVVRSDIPLDTNVGVWKRRLVNGVAGTGGTKLSMNSMNGDIVIQRSST